MNFDALAGLVKGHLLGQLERNAQTEPNSVVIYRCKHGHQAVRVNRGPNNYCPLDRIGPKQCCLRCLGQRGDIVEMR